MNDLIVKMKERFAGPCCDARLVGLLLITFFATPLYAVDFKGIDIGQPLWIGDERSVFGVLDCNPMGLEVEQYERYLLELQSIMPGVRKICYASTSIATIPADATVLLGTSRRVLRLTLQFAGNEYPRVVEAMTSKWGDGIAEVRDEFDKSIWWDFEDGTTVSAHQVPPESATNPDKRPVGLVEYSVPVVTPESDL
jgi:hypothetical protein